MDMHRDLEIMPHVTRKHLQTTPDCVRLRDYKTIRATSGSCQLPISSLSHYSRIRHDLPLSLTSTNAGSCLRVDAMVQARPYNSAAGKLYVLLGPVFMRS